MTKKMNKTKKRGGHIFYFEENMGEKCRTGFLGMHENDCWPNTLYLLGILTREMAERFATDPNYVSKKSGISSEAIINWLNKSLGQDHSYDTLFDSQMGFDNDWFMGYLNFLLPYNFLGMPVSYELLDERGRYIRGHVFCIIKDENGQFRLLDAQLGIDVVIESVDTLRDILPNEGHRLVLYGFMQTTLYDKWHRRTNNTGNYNVSPFKEDFYNTANNRIRAKMAYPGLNYKENGNNEGWNQGNNKESNNGEGNNGEWNKGNNENGNNGEWNKGNNENGNNRGWNQGNNENGNNRGWNQGNNGNNEGTNWNQPYQETPDERHRLWVNKYGVYGLNEEGYDEEGKNRNGYTKENHILYEQEQARKQLQQKWNMEEQNMNDARNQWFEERKRERNEQEKQRIQKEQEEREEHQRLHKLFLEQKKAEKQEINRLEKLQKKSLPRGLGVTRLLKEEPEIALQIGDMRHPDGNWYRLFPDGFWYNLSDGFTSYIREWPVIQGEPLKYGDREGPDGDWYRQLSNGIWYDINDGGISTYSVWPDNARPKKLTQKKTSTLRPIESGGAEFKPRGKGTKKTSTLRPIESGGAEFKPRGKGTKKASPLRPVESGGAEFKPRVNHKYF
jgi:hypothetical protein